MKRKEIVAKLNASTSNPSSKKDFVQAAWEKQGAYSRTISDGYEPRPGLEGPFRFKSGRVLYYDPREGAYYDPGSDFYLDKSQDPHRYNGRRRNAKLSKKAQAAKDAKWKAQAAKKKRAAAALKRKQATLYDPYYYSEPSYTKETHRKALVKRTLTDGVFYQPGYVYQGWYIARRRSKGVDDLNAKGHLKPIRSGPWEVFHESGMTVGIAAPSVSGAKNAIHDLMKRADGRALSKSSAQGAYQYVKAVKATRSRTYARNPRRRNRRTR
jgi:hypothetical protein